MRNRVLIVEDDDSIRELYSELLEAEGYEALTSKNGREALALLKNATHLPALIVTDYLMPQMNGLELIEAIQSDERLHPTPIVLISAMNPSCPKGVEFIKKPLEIETMLKKVNQYCVKTKILKIEPSTLHLSEETCLESQSHFEDKKSSRL